MAITRLPVPFSGSTASDCGTTTATFTPRFVEQWTVAGTPRQCVADLQAYFDAGVGHMALRLASWDQPGQLKRFLGEVAPAFGGR